MPNYQKKTNWCNVTAPFWFLHLLRKEAERSKGNLVKTGDKCKTKHKHLMEVCFDVNLLLLVSQLLWILYVEQSVSLGKSSGSCWQQCSASAHFRRKLFSIFGKVQVLIGICDPAQEQSKCSWGWGCDHCLAGACPVHSSFEKEQLLFCLFLELRELTHNVEMT